MPLFLCVDPIAACGHSRVTGDGGSEAAVTLLCNARKIPAFAGMTMMVAGSAFRVICGVFRVVSGRCITD